MIDIKSLIEQETGLRFNRANKICCPLHKEKTPSFSIDTKTNKWKCFGCGLGGDSIDFLKEYKNFNYVEACKYLNIPLNEEYSALESEEKKITSFINWQFKNWEEMREWKLIKLYRFSDKENKTLYYKAKFKTQNKKEIRYYSIDENNNVKASRNGIEVPYNYFRVAKALENERSVIIVEGEKDADTLTFLGYIATSFKGIKEFDLSVWEDAIVYFIADTGKAGEEYKKQVFFNLRETVKSFRLIELPGIEELGDNADVSDWFKVGHTKEEFKIAMADYWDIKRNYNFKYIDSKNKPLKIWQNLNILLKSKKIKIKYNVLSKTVEYEGSLISKDYGNNAVLEDIFSLCQTNGFNMTRDNLGGALNRIAKQNSYNPVKDYLNKCLDTWDGSTNNIEALADTIVMPENFDEDYKRLLLRKWLLNVANIAFNQGHYGSEGILVIQGPQGIGKTRWISSIIPKKPWVKTGLEVDPSNKDMVHQATKYWVSELGELDATLKKDQAKLKAFFTSNMDEYRRPYDRSEEAYPRLTAFYATVNKEEFLKDETGNRRYWTIPAEKMIVDHSIDLDKLWGEVMFLLNIKKEPYWLTEEDKELLRKNNENFEVKDEVFIKIQDGFKWDVVDKKYWHYYKVAEIAELLEIKNYTALGNALKKFGAEKRRTNSFTRYLLPPVAGEVALKFENKQARRWS